MSSNNEPPPQAANPPLVVFFNYRSLLDAEDLDQINYQAWCEVLEAFGYADLTFPRFLSDLALKSPAEVMMALCPYTTRAEWGPLLNKRDVRLERDVNNLCYVELLPIDGIRDFLIDCSKNAMCTTVFISPFKEDVSRKVLEKAELNAFVDVVHAYTDREFGVLEALELINARPPVIPANLHHKWEKEDEDRQKAAAATNADLEQAQDGCATAGDAEEAKESMAKQQKQALADRNVVEIVAFESDVSGVVFAKQFGAKVIGVDHNPVGTQIPEGHGHHHHQQSPATATQHNDDAGDGASASTRRTSDDESLLDAGASIVVEDFTTLKYEYLHMMK